MNIKPLGDHVLVKPLEKEKMTKTGIVLPDTVEKDELEQGEVIAVGPGKILENGHRSPMSVKGGDKVILKKYGPDKVKIDGIEYLVAEENDIIGTIA
jgi:chaperonin GroES